MILKNSSQLRQLWNIGSVSVLALALSFCSKDSGTKSQAPSAAASVPTGTTQETTFASLNAFSGPNTSMNGVTAVAPGQVQVNQDVSLYSTPYIWVSNSDDNTISKIDTKTLMVVGTYPLVGPSGEPCYSSSRTTVDINGDVWVGCRGSVSGPAGLDSYNQYPNVQPSWIPKQVDHKVLKVSGQDGHIIKEVFVGLAPRGLALDRFNHLWVAMSVDNTVWELDATTGACLLGDPADFLGRPTGCPQPSIKVGSFPYGAAVDQRQHVWVTHRQVLNGVTPVGPVNQVDEIDALSATLIKSYGPFSRNGCTELYGIAIDQLNNIWLSGWYCNDVIALKGGAGISPMTGQSYQSGDLIVDYPASAGGSPQGIAIDNDGNIWAACTATDTAEKMDAATGKLLNVVNVGATPIGIGVDAYSNAWVVNRGSNNVTLINGLDTTKTQNIAVGNGPYTYSDMLGTALRTITYADGSVDYWRTKVDSGLANPHWDTVHWDAYTPTPTTLTVRVRCAATSQALDAAAWGPFINAPGPVDCGGGSGEWAQVEVDFNQNGSTSSPILKDLTLHWTAQ